MADDRIDIEFGAQIEGLLEGVQQVIGLIASLAAPVQDVVALFGQMKASLAAAFPVGEIAGFADKFSQLGGEVRQTSDAVGATAERIGKAGSSILPEFRATLSEMEVSFDGTHRGMLAAAFQMWQQEKSTANLSAQDILAVRRGLAEALIALHREEASERAKAAKQAQEIARNDSQTEIQLGKLKLQAQKDELDTEVAYGEISTRQKIAALKRLTVEENQAAVTHLEQERSTYDAGTVGYEKYTNQIAVLQQKLTNELAKLNQQAAMQALKSWQSMLTPIEHAFDQMIQGLLQRTQSFHQMMARVAQGLVMSFVQARMKIEMDWIAGQLAMAFGAQEWASKSLLSWLASILGIKTAQVAADSEKVASAAATAAATAPIAIAAGFSQISVDAAVAAAGTMASISAIPYVGPFMAPEMAAEAYALTMGFAAGMGGAALDVGAWEIPGTMAATLHAGETVLPKTFADGFRSAVGGGEGTGTGGMNITFAPQVSALDARSVVALFNNPSIMRQFARNLGAYMTANPSARPAY